MSITGPIDRLRRRYLARGITHARDTKLDTLVVHIDTDGGTVIDARDMFKLVLDQDKDGPRMVALVDFRAISAGAMIAYAHHELYVSETASIGDIGVIFKSPEGEIKYAPEKIETVVRTLLAQASELRGWNRGLLLKMTAHQQKLYRVTLPDGQVDYVIEDDFPELLARYPTIDKDDQKQVILYRGEDRLITLTGREAVRLGMATALVADKESLYQRMGVTPETVVDLSPQFAELTAWRLAPFTPVLAGLAILFILFEIKTPGIGLWAALGAVCGGLFLLAHFYLDLAENVEIVLIAGGIVLLAVELLTGFGAGLLGALGALMTLGGLVLAFIPNDSSFDFSDERFRTVLGEAGLSAVMALCVVAVGLVAFISLVPRSKVARGLSLDAAITATSAGRLKANEASLIGRVGTAGEALHPSGTVFLDSEGYSARVEHAAYVAAGQSVEVVAVAFGELVVRPVTGDARSDE
jgi:membrane-bound serine protease (ClpP class)